MKIGALAATTGTPVETIRYYEREGLLPLPARTDNNYRTYQRLHVERLAFIRRCRHLDMTLDEIRALIKHRETPARDCSEINALLDTHIGHVTQRIRDLRALEGELKALRASCPMPNSLAGCGILNALDGDQGAPAAKGVRRPHVHGAH